MSFIARFRLRAFARPLVSLTIGTVAMVMVPASVGGQSAFPMATKSGPGSSGPYVSAKVKPYVFNGSVRTLPVAAPGRLDLPAIQQPLGSQTKPQPNPGASVAASSSGTLSVSSSGSGASSAAGVTPSQFSTASPNADGIGYTQVVPPDTNGAPGLNHYIQIINSKFEIFDKQLNSLAGPTNINQLWVNAGDTGNCATRNDGDPVVLYDHVANRWLISQFAIPNGTGGTPGFECVAISKTSDPVNGGWFVYTFRINNAFDYPKLGLWPDGYYMSSQEGGSGSTNVDAYAFDRANMLNGNPATYQQFTISGTSSSAGILLPSDLSGPPPAMGTPNVFARAINGAVLGGSDRIELWSFSVNWGVPSSSTFTQLPDLTPAPFNSNLCGNGSGSGQSALNDDCAPQPNTTQQLETLARWSMGPLQYRTFNGYNTLAFDHTVAGQNANQPAPRWYELRESGGTWSIYQQATYAPDSTTARWMGSIAMDKAGDLALGYSASDATSLNPSVRWVGRLASDPLGTMSQGEFTMVNGVGEQISNGDRWGDYSAMRVDPADGCTFWYTQEYIGSLTLASQVIPTDNAWSTRIGAFRFPTCNPADLALSDFVTPNPAVAGTSATWQLTVANIGTDTAKNVVLTETLPAGASFQTSTVACTQSAQTLNCPLGTMTNGQFVTVNIQAMIDPFLDMGSGGPVTITDSASVISDELDPNPANNSASAPLTVNELADQQTTKSCDASVLAGQSGKCTIYVDNNGPSAARSVKLTDTATSDGTFTMSGATSSQGSCSGTPATGTSVTLTCSLGTLGPATISGPGRATIVVSYTANEGQTINDVATATSPTPDPNSANNQASASLPVTAMSDLQITSMTATPNPAVFAGTQLTYSTTVKNNGPSTAQNVVFSQSLPAGVTVQSITAPGATKCNTGTPGNSLDPATCGFDVLAPGASATMTIVTNVLPSTTGILHSDASVTSSTFDPNNSNNFAHTDTTVAVQADLSAALTTANGSHIYQPSSVVTYVGTATNAGPSDAQSVELVFNLPGSKVGSIVTHSGVCLAPVVTTSSTTLRCSIGTLAAGSSVSIQVQFFIQGNKGTLITTDQVSSTTADPNSANNSASWTVSTK